MTNQKASLALLAVLLIYPIGAYSALFEVTKEMTQFELQKAKEKTAECSLAQQSKESAFAWFDKELKRIGYSGQIDKVEKTIANTDVEEFQVSGRPVSARRVAGSQETKGQLKGVLLDGGMGTLKDFDALNLDGAFVLIDGKSQPSTWLEPMSFQVMGLRAKGLIIPQDALQDEIGSELQLPTITVSRDDFKSLQQRAKGGKTEVQLTMTGDPHKKEKIEEYNFKLAAPTESLLLQGSSNSCEEMGAFVSMAESLAAKNIRFKRLSINLSDKPEAKLDSIFLTVAPWPKHDTMSAWTKQWLKFDQSSLDFVIPMAAKKNTNKYDISKLGREITKANQSLKFIIDSKQRQELDIAVGKLITSPIEKRIEVIGLLQSALKLNMDNWGKDYRTLKDVYALVLKGQIANAQSKASEISSYAYVKRLSPKVVQSYIAQVQSPALSTSVYLKLFQPPGSQNLDALIVDLENEIDTFHKKISTRHRDLVSLLSK